MDDAEANIRNIEFKEIINDMEEEQTESENEMAEDEEMDNEILGREMIWGLFDRDRFGDDGGANVDMELIGAGGADMDNISQCEIDFDYYEEIEIEADMENEEFGNYIFINYGSLIIIIEDFDAFDGLDYEAYDEYRWQLFFDARGMVK